VVSAVFPPDGATVQGTRLRFQWDPPDSVDGDAIVDYEFLLSDRPDLRWPLSSNFHRLVSLTPDSGRAQFTLPYLGLLNSDTVYYWAVRARDAQGAWSEWSPPFSFTTLAPHPPENVRLSIDSAGRTGALLWSPAALGTSPVLYKVYGSNEKGFSVSDAAYVVWVGNQGAGNSLTSPFAANLIGETGATSYAVIGAGSNVNRAFYRVVAVDANGNESGPSDYAEVPRPFIFTRPPLVATAGQSWAYQAASIASLGDLRSKTIGGNQYEANYWDVEHPAFALTSGPAWLEIDPASGQLTGTPDAPGTFPVTVTASIGAQADSQQFTLTVGP
jgi:hypothetical protein